MSTSALQDKGIRSLTPDDLPVVTAIFNESVKAGEATIDTQPRTVEQIKAWLTGDLPRYEVYVYERGAGIDGWAAITRYHEREAYSPTAELAVYVRRSARRAGAGRTLLELLLERSGQLGFHSAVLIIFPEPRYVIESAKKLGFLELGQLHSVAPVEGGWRDIVLLQTRLGQEGVKDDSPGS